MASLAVRVLAGPLFYWRSHRAAAVGLIVLAAGLTVITQVGGPVLWLSTPLMAYCRRAGRRFGVPAGMAAFAVVYLAVVLVIVPVAAPLFGRVSLPFAASLCEPIRPVNMLTVLAARNYVRPEVRAVLAEAARTVADMYPGSIRVNYDANFPFIDGFPLLPHLGHKDGRKVDLAYYYRNKKTGRPVHDPPSPVGYWAYEAPRLGEEMPCRGREGWLRWDFDQLQPAFSSCEMDPARTRTLLTILVGSKRIQKVLIEPHLKVRLGIRSRKVRFQGCRAARHDDHIHVQFH